MCTCLLTHSHVSLGLCTALLGGETHRGMVPACSLHAFAPTLAFAVIVHLALSLPVLKLSGQVCWGICSLLSLVVALIVRQHSSLKPKPDSAYHTFISTVDRSFTRFNQNCNYSSPPIATTAFLFPVGCPSFSNILL